MERDKLHIDRLKNKWKELQQINKRVKLNSCLSEKKIQAFEEKYNIQLPKEYKSFLLEMGDGGSGPGYGLYSLSEASITSDWYYFLDHIHKPFFFTKDWLCDEEYGKELSEEYLITYGENYKELIYNISEEIDSFDGCLLICHHGCASLDQLVVTGAKRGTIWNNSDSSGSGIWNTNENFLAWYEKWIDEQLIYSYEYLDQIKKLQGELNIQSESEKPYFEIGKLYYHHLGDVEKANSFFDKSLETEKLTWYEYRMIAAQKYQKQEYEISITYALKALELLKMNSTNKHSESELYQGIGQSYYLMKKFPLAIDYFQKSIIGYEDIYKSEEVYFWIAKSYFESKQFLLAIEYLQKCHEDKWTYNLFSNAYAGLRDWDHCILFYEKTIELDPEWIVARDNRGYYYSLMGQYEKAIEIHQEIIEEDPLYAWAYYNMAVAYVLQNKIEEAIPYFIKAVELGYDKQDIINDADIDNLKGTEVYKKLILS